MDDRDEGLLTPNGPSRSSGFDTISQWRSYVLAMALKKLESDTGPFDIIEFTDWGGPAFYTIQEKKLGTAFDKSVLSVRLHSSEGSLRAYETRGWGFENLVISDMERSALRDADIVVGHLQTIVEANKQLYCFDETWLVKTLVNVPPIVNKIERKKTTSLEGPTTSILFTSKIQSFKRPDTFIRGCAEFAMNSVDYRGDIVFLAFEVDSSLRSRVQDAIPAPLKSRVRFLGLTAQEDRERIISQSVAVFPGVYESFCYAAYEASLSGAIVILNATNPAFGPNTPWLEGINCLKFDGTADDLARVLGDLFEQASKGVDHGLSPIDISHAEIPYWESVALPVAMTTNGVNGEANADCPGMSVIIAQRDQGPELLQSISSLLTEQALPLDTIVVDDASDSPDTQHILEQLDKTAESRSVDAVLRIVRRKAAGGYAVSLNSTLASLRHDIVCILSPGDRVEPGFLQQAALALSRSNEYAAIIPAARIIQHPGDLKAATHFMPLGEPLGTGLFVNRACSTVMICRRDVLDSYKFDEVMSANWNWDFIMRLLADGHRVMTTAEIGAEIVRSNDWAQTWSSEVERREIFDAIHRRFSASGPGWRLPLTSIGDGEMISIGWYHAGPMNVAEASERQADGVNPTEELMRLRNATSVRIALALANGVKQTTPWLHKPMRRYLRKKLDG
ncbi:MAG: glycosyltransferase [Hyphomicrobiaceae bacterium]